MKKYWKWNVSFVVCVMLICMFKSPVWAKNVKDEIRIGSTISVIEPTIDGMMPDGCGTDLEEPDGEESLYTYLGTKSSVTSISSSNLKTPQYWKLNISGTELEILLHGNNLEDGTRTMVKIADSVGNGEDRWGTMESGECIITVPLDSYPDGKYKVTLYFGKEIYGYVWSVASYVLQIEEDDICFIDCEKRTEAEKFIDKLNQRYDPADYSGIPAQYYEYYAGYYVNMKSARVDEIADKARELTEQCTTNEEKVLVIHDWVCRNFAYDKEACYDDDITNATDIDWVYENRRGVCSGIARMCNLMFTAVGVPSMTVTGYAYNNGTEGLSANAMYTSTNHEWNVVYLNGSWQNMDVTWDCQNKYYGKYDGLTTEDGMSYGTSVFDQDPGYTYYASPSFNFGGTHYSMQVGALEYVSNISFYSSPTRTKFDVGDDFVCDGVLYCELSNGKKKIISLKGKEDICCSGYDMSKKGKQIVTVSYCGQELGYMIQVGEEETCTWHTGGTATCVTPAVCEICGTSYGTVDSSAHWYDAGVVTKEPTCTEQGVMTYTCSLCGAIRQEMLPKAEHDFKNIWETDREATTMVTGIESRHCKNCGARTDIRVLPVIEDDSKDGIDDSIEIEDDKDILDDMSQAGNEPDPDDGKEADLDDETGVDDDVQMDDEVEYDEEFESDEKEQVGKTEPDKSPIVNTSDSTKTQLADMWNIEDGEEEEGDVDLETEDKTESGDIISTADGTEYEILDDGTLSYSSAGRKRRSIIIPEKVVIEGKQYKVTKIAEEAFVDETSLVKITIPKSIQVVGEGAFSGCKKLKTVSGGNGITTIAERAFYNCGLSSITISESVVKIGKEAFKGCKSLKTIQIKTTKLKNKNVGKNAFKNTADKLKVSVPKNKITEYKKILKSKGASKKMTIKK